MKDIEISVVSPVYRAEKIVPELVKQLVYSLKETSKSFEIILVNDGSPDNSWSEIEKQCNIFPEVVGLKMSRNFGQHFAITAGIEHAKGEYVIIIDCDLQDDPKYIPQLIAKADEGFDIVFTEKIERRHSFIKNLTTSLFNRIFNYLIDNKEWKAHKNIGSFSLLKRNVVNEFIRVNDYYRHYLMLVRWLGFSKAYITIEHHSRFEGKSSYSFSKLINHAINGIVYQSDKLLRLTVNTGIIISFLSFIWALVIIGRYYMHGFLSGWTSLIVVILFSTGTILTSIGILGIYLSKTFEQTKNRPKYIIQDKRNI